MVDALPPGDEDGTSLVELLVVMVIMAIVGTITTVGVVQGFRTQLDATNVAETLDGTRIATQRVRDFVRGATEVCASSDADTLVLWTDDDADGSVVNTELDIFEVATDATGQDVFQRRTPTATGDVTQLIRDDIINAALFTYDASPAAQPASTVCTDGVTPSGGPSATRLVDVEFTVQNPDPSDPPLTTATQVRLRNADLVATPSNSTPNATFVVDCPAPDRTCTFDASASDDSDGTIASYDWTFARQDGTVLGTATGVTTSFTFPVGDVAYDVTLVVTDDDGASDTATDTATPVEPGTNVPPTAEFTFTCTGLQCNFDGSGSSDDVGIVTYAWKYGSSASGSGVTDSYSFPSNGTYAVTLTVTDGEGATGEVTKTVTAGTQTIIVSSLTGASINSRKQVRVEVQLSLTTAGTPGDGVQVTFLLTPARGTKFSQEATCTTDANGRCDAVVSVNKNQDYPIGVTIESVTNTGTYTYDPDQNTDDTETIT